MSARIAVEEADLYAAIDLLADKLDRQVIRYKDKLHAKSNDSLKHQEPPPS